MILALGVSMNMVEAGSKGMSAENLPREECAQAQGKISVEAQRHTRLPG
ncbi:hypothetical protein [Leisingera daeponensis]|nr:hypothetical protein [Leisingera daeponensis]MBY6059715.1 hypothetical protein [Leisingera daeponensis]